MEIIVQMYILAPAETKMFYQGFDNISISPYGSYFNSIDTESQ